VALSLVLQRLEVTPFFAGRTSPPAPTTALAHLSDEPLNVADVWNRARSRPSTIKRERGIAAARVIQTRSAAYDHQEIPSCSALSLPCSWR
jgi:hypothetical protein